MIDGAIATVMVSDFDKAIEFYTNTLGLKLLRRFGNEWAEVGSDKFKIGLHPASEHGPKPGTAGGISIGLGIPGKIEEVVSTLKERGVQFHGSIIDNEKDPVKLAFFGDHDGNTLYLCEEER